MSHTIISTEVYDTLIRSTAYSFSTSIARLASTMMPIISVWLMSYGSTKPFLAITPLFIVITVLFYKFFHETRGCKLDTYDDQE